MLGCRSGVADPHPGFLILESGPIHHGRTNAANEGVRTISKEEAIELEGHVAQVLGNGNFKVEISESHSVLAQIAGKMRKHRIRVLPGDRVRIEVSPYDLSRGRITYRFRN